MEEVRGEGAEVEDGGGGEEVEERREGIGSNGTHLFHFEDVLVEVLLELFIGIVDAELLKRVLQEHLKTKYVQYSNRISL